MVVTGVIVVVSGAVVEVASVACVSSAGLVEGIGGVEQAPATATSEHTTRPILFRTLTESAHEVASLSHSGPLFEQVLDSDRYTGHGCHVTYGEKYAWHEG